MSGNGHGAGITRRWFAWLLAAATGSLLPTRGSKGMTGMSPTSAVENVGTGSYKNPTIGIALGAGGAKGIAHIAMLEALDEIGLRPSCIAGSSIGALMGMLYAAGRSAAEVKDLVAHLAITRKDTVRSVHSDKKIGKWMRMIDPDFHHGGLLEGASILEGLCRDRDCGTFEELVTPLKVFATDFWARRSVVFETGPMQPAVQASMALPGVFNPVEIDGRVYIDGGTINPVPYDVLSGCCDLVVAIDVNGGCESEGSSAPGYFDVVFGSIQILQQAIVQRQLEHHQPDIYLSLDLGDFRTLEFHKADEIYRHVQPAKEELKRRLTEELESRAKDS